MSGNSTISMNLKFNCCISLCVFALCSLCLCGSFSSAADKPQAKKVTYQDNVLPILREKCMICHDSEKVKGGLDVSSYTKLMEGGGSGAVVKPGDSAGSRLFGVVSHTVEPKMPPKSDKIPQPYI